jgi:hypothetical protein
MGRWREKWSEEDGSEELETEGAREEAMERNNWESQNPQRVVELKNNNNNNKCELLIKISVGYT